MKEEKNVKKDIYIVSLDEKFSRMLNIALEENGIVSVISKSVPKKKCFLIVDLDTVKDGGFSPDITFSREKERKATLERPFEVSEFISKVKDLLTYENDEANDLRFDGKNLFYSKEEIKLSEIELSIFSILYEKRGKVVSTEEITSRVWKKENTGNSIVVYMNYLRKKIDFRFGKRFIITVRGKGYMLAGRSEL